MIVFRTFLFLFLCEKHHNNKSFITDFENGSSSVFA